MNYTETFVTTESLLILLFSLSRLGHTRTRNPLFFEPSLACFGTTRSLIKQASLLCAVTNVQIMRAEGMSARKAATRVGWLLLATRP